MSLPVLMYHHILPQSGYIAMGVQEFEKQLQFLFENKYRTLSSDEFFFYKTKKMKFPKKSILITFDDGWRDNKVFAYPLLKRYCMRATLFVPTLWVERSSASFSNESFFLPQNHASFVSRLEHKPYEAVINWSECQELSDVFDIESHTHSHLEDPSFTMEEELRLSRELITSRMGTKGLHLCWPRGHFNEKSVISALEVGYKCLYTTLRGGNFADGDGSSIKRLSMKPGVFWLKKSLSIYSSRTLSFFYRYLKKS